MPNKRILVFSLVAALVLLAAFMSGFVFHAFLISANEPFPILKQAYTILQANALNELPPAKTLEYGMIRGMLEAYDDPYTTFVEPAQHELETESLQGKFGGIGVDLVLDAQDNIVLIPFPDSPAARAGILEGDRLLSVQDLKIDSKTSIDSIKAAIRGPEGEVVHILVARPPDFIEHEFSITRKAIALPSTTWYIDPSESRLGVIKVNIIAASTPDEIESAVQDLEARGGTHFALDLRDNGGGLLTTGVDTTRLFLRDGVIIEQQYRGKSKETYRVEKPGPLVDIPLVVLVNHSTASAAEIIAGALQAHNRAVLIGEPTYGKNTIQLVFDLRDGSSLHVTSAQWWIPGQSIPGNGVGLQPDILLTENGKGGDQAINAAIQFLFHRQ